MKVREAGYDELQFCPAAVEIDGTGEATLLVNRITFPAADSFAQKFYVAHELGHWLLATGSEEDSDAFAIALLAGTEHRSLKKSIESLYRIRNIPYSRMLKLYNLALTIDKQHQNATIMKKKIWDNPSPILINRADGENGNTTDITDIQTNTAVMAANVLGDIIGGNNRRRAGLRINNVFFSLESILMAAILIAVIVLCAKK